MKYSHGHEYLNTYNVQNIERNTGVVSVSDTDTMCVGHRTRQGTRVSVFHRHVVCIVSSYIIIALLLGAWTISLTLKILTGASSPMFICYFSILNLSNLNHRDYGNADFISTLHGLGGCFCGSSIKVLKALD